MFRIDYRHPPVEMRGEGAVDQATGYAKEMVRRLVVTGCGEDSGKSYTTMGVRG